MRYLCFDLETTGTDLERDRIVEISVAEWEPGLGSSQLFYTLIDPLMPIPPSATEVHGITDEDVEGAPEFADVAHEVAEMIYGSALVGYNIRKFDVPLLDRELRDADQAGIELEHVREVDLLKAWFKLEPRSLADAIRRFTDREPDEERLHGARYDVTATCDVGDGFMRTFGVDIDTLEALSKDEDEVDRFGKFVRREDGEIVFNFGKHKGERAMDHQDYLTWMMSDSASFHPHVKEVVRQLAYQPWLF